MIQFKVNNNLKAEPVILGLRVSNLIYLAMILIIGMVMFGMSSHLGLNNYAIGVFFLIILTIVYFYLKRMQKKEDYGYLDKYIARILQPKKIGVSDMKLVIQKRSKNEVRRY